jgi:hypothetical protein
MRIAGTGEQMEPDQELKGIAALRYTREIERISRDYIEERRKKLAELSAKGMLMSGAMLKVQVELQARHALEAAEAHSSIWVDVLTRKFGKITSEDIDFICEGLSTILAGSRHLNVQSAIKLSPATMDSTKEMLGRELKSIESGIRRDLDIMRLEQESLPAVSTSISPGTITNIYHLHGHGSRVNVNSSDTSINHVAVNSSQLFSGIRASISEGVADEGEKGELLARVNELEASADSPAFATRYTDFIAAAANHMTLLAPFFPALAEVLRKALNQ